MTPHVWHPIPPKPHSIHRFSYQCDRCGGVVSGDGTPEAIINELASWSKQDITDCDVVLISIIYQV